MPDFSLRVDATAALSLLDATSRQAPFAVSKAINETLKIGQRNEIDRIHGQFTVRRSTYVDRTVKMLQFANKATLTGVLGIDPNRDILAKFETGGQKRPVSGTALAVPVEVRRSKGGIVVKNLRVRSLALTKHTTASGRVQLKGLLRTFAVKSAKGGAILQRVGRKVKGTSIAQEIAAGSLRILYAFKRSVPIPANLSLIPTVTKAVNDHWVAEMLKAWDYAVSTAK